MFSVQRAPLIVLDHLGRTVFDRVFVPNDFLARLRGLLGRESPRLHEAWMFPRCSAVHTVGMHFPIDIIHLSSQGVILRICARVPPGRLRACRGATDVLEIQEGAAAAIPLEVGQRLEFRQ